MDIALKQRLIGAVILVALAVIFLPLLIRGPAPDSGVADVPLKAPPAPNDAKFETRELPLPSPTTTSNTTQIGNAPLQPPPNVVKESSDVLDAKRTLPPDIAAGNYAVNFGAYSSPIDANKVIVRLKQAQLPGFSEKTQVNGAAAWLVRIGPYADQAQAEAVRLEAIKIRSDVNARVVVLDAKAESPVAKPRVSSTPSHVPVQTQTSKLPVKHTQPPTTGATAAAAKSSSSPTKTPVTFPIAPKTSIGFAVQLGAFVRLEDANALCDRARAAGFNAFVEQVNTDQGSLHRVRVGPVPKREAAYQLKAQVAAKIGIIGMVRSHP
ncbi:SPOR domain-containing protein [Xylella fastidiosa subsp. pauca]|uniref:SPOR domain-containing protein n=1 Tax=Xylella fastidiosa TaxID=2371 RepID=UPI0005829E8A|nr:SPOR domain-containing protein [Xylella fastidiosa]ARO68465.1 SPOR domain-containing protein [Xylella fastidiosa subsp. pauca]AVI20589.1 sporulation protein [Xylella fastidiosa]AVI22608.1 sporulation protein [Xylella fastidiosa]KIA57715.1 sporulation protein [Xylella fastidiosa]KXB13088.1 sporulation protein [Xylella fastidiosa]